jgi:TetR/AcrR family transcriptional repressor of nem operon
MARSKSFDQDAVLDRAAELFWERGYEGTSMAHLEVHLGLGRQSLYNAFGDKQALFLKALERYRKEAMREPISVLTAPGAGLEAIRAYFRDMIEHLTAATPRRACLVANTIVERGAQDAEALLSCNIARAALERALRRALTQARQEGEIAAECDLESLVTLLVAQSYGLAVLAKTGVAAEEMHAAVEALLAGVR